jgi:hypothetical protein
MRQRDGDIAFARSIVAFNLGQARLLAVTGTITKERLVNAAPAAATE